MAKKILIINEGYSSNLGDQVIKESMEKLMQSLGYDTDFCYFTDPQLLQLPSYQYQDTLQPSANFLSSIKKKMATVFSVFIYCRYYFNLKKQIKTKLLSQQYDKIIIGGGQLINSSKKRQISFFAIALFVWAMEIKKISNLPLYLIGVGAAGKFHAIEKGLYKKALKEVTAIWVRDTFSAKSISKFFDITSELIPDVAFFNPDGFRQHEKNNLALVGIYSYEEYKTKFNVTEKNKESYYGYWKVIVEKFIGEGKKVSLFYTTVTDAQETLLFKKYLDQEKINTSIASVSSLYELNRLLETAESVYSARMHALILALKKGCNVEAYLISQKLRSFNDEYIKPAADLETMSNGLHATFKKAFKD